jgi:MoaA/NifB/PqqE/SkfB family radical SAM enzyme
MSDSKTGFDFSERPFLVIWETTRACDLACVHCRAAADPRPGPYELTFQEGLHLIEQEKEMGTPVLVFSGGDALKKHRIEDLVGHADSLGLRTGLIPAVTPLLTRERMERLKRAGLDQIAFSLDAASAPEHDAFRRTQGVFDRTLESIETAHEMGLPVQINSLVNVHNHENFQELIELVRTLDIVFWEIFFLIPVGRGRALPLMSAQKFEEVFELIFLANR